MNVQETQNKLLSLLPPSSTILDIGGGKSRDHAKFFELHKHKIKVNDFFANSDYIGKFIDISFNDTFDAIWCSHCLEHQLNVNQFLCKINSITRDNGLVAITVPPLKHMIVGGHVSLWNAGLVLYNLVLANFDCSRAMIKTYGYNISVIIRKKYIELPSLIYDRGDLDTLRQYFPEALNADKWGQFNGNIKELNWD